ncbi:MAG: sensor histidine kinase, partial [Chitinophagaceae bacterium]
LVLMDVQMPIMDGLTATKIIRNELKLEIPILAMTAGVMEEEQQNCRDAGMNDIIAKPIDVAQMLRTLTNYISVDRPFKQNKTPENNSSIKSDDAETQKNVIVAPETNPSADTIFDPTQLMLLATRDHSYLAVVVNLIKSVVDSGQTKFNTMLTAYMKGDHAEAAAMLHSMRGSIGTLGARRFASSALALELAIKNDKPLDVEPLIRVTEQTLRDTITEASIWIEQQQINSTNQISSIASDASFANMKQFRKLLSEQNLAACDRYEQLKSFLGSRLTEENFSNLDAAINGLNFDDALNILDLMSYRASPKQW